MKEPRKAPKQSSGVSITVFLALVLGAVVLLSAGSVMLLLVRASEDAVRRTMGEQGVLFLSRTAQDAEQFLGQGPRTTGALESAIRNNTGDFDTAKMPRVALQGALASLPDAIQLVVSDGRSALQARRHLNGQILVAPVPLSEAPKTDDRMVGWLAPRKDRESGKIVLSYVDRLSGAEDKTIAVRIDFLADAFSRQIGDGVRPPLYSFVLSGREAVAAYSGPITQSDQVPTIETVDDGRLGAIWTKLPGYAELPSPLSGHISVTPGTGERTVFLYKQLDDAAEKPFIAGIYMPARYFGSQLDHLLTAILGSGGILVASLVFAVLLGRLIARPVHRLSAAAGRLKSLDLKSADRLPKSFLREIDEANSALNAAVAGLSAFSRFVPRALVRRLMQLAAGGEVNPEIRDISVLFTDIVGYTATTEGMAPEETAAFLNEHFSLIGSCVEQEGGTIDKFIGDSVMAFWGAPDAQPDHAVRAARAAIAIAAAIRENNASRPVPVRLRIGVYSGPVIVGTIGSPQRTNYTVIGEPVNIASRLEQLGKSVDPQADVIALAGGTLADAARDGAGDGDSAGTYIGEHLLRGMENPIDVVRLV